MQGNNTFHKLVIAHQQALHSVSDENGHVQNGHANVHEKRSKPVQQKLINVRPMSKEQLLSKKTSLTEDQPVHDQLIQEEQRETSASALRPYLDYVNVSKGWLVTAATLIAQIAFSLIQLFGNVWLATQLTNTTITKGLLIGVYGGTSVLAVALFYFRSNMVVNLGLQASDSFYRGVSNAIMKAPMSFFDSTPSGRILSRVSFLSLE